MAHETAHDAEKPENFADPASKSPVDTDVGGGLARLGKGTTTAIFSEPVE